MATLSLVSKAGYKGGEPTSVAYVGNLGSGQNYVIRFEYKTPDCYLKALNFSITYRHASGSTGNGYVTGVKVTTDATSHINAGTSTTDFDAKFTVTGTATATRSVTIENLWLPPNTTFYVYLFPLASDGYWQKLTVDTNGWEKAELTYEDSAIVSTYALVVSAGTGFTVTVERTSSPSGSTGALSDGATIFAGDVLQITFAAKIGYELITHTVNGTSFTSGNTHTVAEDVTVVAIAKTLGLVYIDNGTTVEAYLIYIDNGSSWDQYIPYIDNGSGWDICN